MTFFELAPIIESVQTRIAICFRRTDAHQIYYIFSNMSNFLLDVHFVISSSDFNHAEPLRHLARNLILQETIKQAISYIIPGILRILPSLLCREATKTLRDDKHPGNTGRTVRQREESNSTMR